MLAFNSIFLKMLLLNISRFSEVAYRQKNAEDTLQVFLFYKYWKAFYEYSQTGTDMIGQFKRH